MTRDQLIGLATLFCALQLTGAMVPGASSLTAIGAKVPGASSLRTVRAEVHGASSLRAAGATVPGEGSLKVLWVPLSGASSPRAVGSAVDPRDFPRDLSDEQELLELGDEAVRLEEEEEVIEELDLPSIGLVNEDKRLPHLRSESMRLDTDSDRKSYSEGESIRADNLLEDLIYRENLAARDQEIPMSLDVVEPQMDIEQSDQLSRLSLLARWRKRRRRDDVTGSEDQFKCVAVSERLSRIWAQDRLAAILEYIDLTSGGTESCLEERCGVEVDFSLFKSPLDKYFSDEVSGTLQVTNTINSILRYERDPLSDGLYSALGRGLLQGSDRVVGVTIYFRGGARTEAVHSIVVEGNGSYGGGKGYTTSTQQQPDELDWPSPSLYDEFLQTHGGVCSTKGADSKEAGTSMMTPQRLGSWGRLSLRCSKSDPESRVWGVPLYAPFFGCSNSRLVVRGILKVELNLRGLDINQCSTDPRTDPFSGSHKCPENFKCIHLAGQGFHSGSYKCDCLIGYYDNSSLAHSFSGSLVQSRHVEWLLGNSNDVTDAQCLACSSGCLKCSNGSSRCLLVYDSLTRGIPLGIESLCITLCVALTFAIVHLRKTKVMKASFWCLLEIVIIGAILLHLTVVVQYFEPNEHLCLLVPWLREIGFTVVYGALILKVYRVLTGFQSRKAHRVEVRDKDLFKYLCCMIIICVSFMAAWTAVTLDSSRDTASALLQYGSTEEGLKYVVCRATWWDYIVEIGELTFILFGVYLCYRARSAPSVCQELRFITVAICNETIVSTVFYVLRHAVYLTLHPDYIFLLYFARCQMTVTVLILLVFGPKLWYTHHPGGADEPRRRAYSGCDLQPDHPLSSASCPEAVKLNSTAAVTRCDIGVTNPNGDVDIGEVNLSDMSPDDIRTELKRLYTQLQIYKTKTMRQDNPHISKRRGGRKQTHRRFSLQAFHNKHHRHHHGSGGGGSDRGFGSDRGEVSVDRGDTEVSRTPEESTNSAEGVSIYMDEPSIAGGIPAVAETNVRTPTVTFKSTEKLRGK